MNKMFVTTIAICLYHMTASATAPGASIDISPECKNLALMQGQLLLTHFQNKTMGSGAYNPTKLVLKTNNGLVISKSEYLGGDGEDEANAGKYPCEQISNLCTTPGNAGGPVDWARVTVSSSGVTSNEVATVVVSMGSRGGCVIDSSAAVK